ncbi:MAG: hypothetical protein PUD16_04555 [bacterium]|nr:hypothetical protein [bacterium]
MKPANREHIYRTIRAGLELVDDRQASEGAALYPEMQYANALIKAGTRINWNGVLKRASVDLWDTTENNPDNAPTLWTDVAYKKGYRIAPDVFTSTNAAAMGELMWFGDKLYRSKMDGNVYTPETAPNAWELVEVTE